MPTNARRTVFIIAAAAAIGACGSPSREFKAVARADGLEVDLPPPAIAAGDAGVDAGADPGAELGGGFVPIAFGLAALPAMPIAQLLGMTRTDIETLLRPVGSDDVEKAAGWVRYSRHLRVRYEGDVAVELTQKVPAGLSCAAAATWIGFPGAGPAVETEERCDWPAGDAARALAEGVSGDLDRAGCGFTARAPVPGQGN
jgi:hypothetical protein